MIGNIGDNKSGQTIENIGDKTKVELYNILEIIKRGI